MTATFAMKSFNPEAPGFTEMARAGVPDFIACDGRSALLSGLTSVLGGIGFVEAGVKSHIEIIEMGADISNLKRAKVFDIQVDIMTFTGLARLMNLDGNNEKVLIPAGESEATEYEYIQPSVAKVQTQNLDLNGDGRLDTVIVKGNVQHIYFNAADGSGCRGQYS